MINIGNLVPPSDSVKDLGVLIDNTLKFHVHTTVIAKANHTLADILYSWLAIHWENSKKSN